MINLSGARARETRLRGAGVNSPGAPSDARRILLDGATGSGKSTAARLIAERLGLPAVLADDIGWLPGWTARDRDDQRAMIAEAAAGELWVIDSAYSSWWDVVLPRTELIIGLDYPRAVSLWRLLRRTAHRIRTGELACNGNRETLRRALGRRTRPPRRRCCSVARANSQPGSARSHPLVE